MAGNPQSPILLRQPLTPGARHVSWMHRIRPAAAERHELGGRACVRSMKAMGIFVDYPWLALIVAGAFSLLWHFRRRRSAAFCAVLWAGYAGYEYLLYARILCTGECNIRVDLLVLYPLLLLASLWAVVSSLLQRRT